MGFPGGPEVKASAACNAGDLGSIPGLGRSPGEGNGNPLQYSCLEDPMDGGALWATVHGVAKSRTRLSNFTHSLIDENVSRDFFSNLHKCAIQPQQPWTPLPCRLQVSLCELSLVPAFSSTHCLFCRWILWSLNSGMRAPSGFVVESHSTLKALRRPVWRCWSHNIGCTTCIWPWDTFYVYI